MLTQLSGKIWKPIGLVEIDTFPSVLRCVGSVAQFLMTENTRPCTEYSMLCR